ncbi:amidohydrolase/deacetylase family metallohydrolase [Psychromarinibacter sp. C21-152]|uniref:Amidohydrolase/deacetylase family metallohydrolase n=1 Tax=Psychromarinibacter sediminicola TaxID=3033385 RepID=A0AAE3NX21_9RHOB|nr:amidohydrolase/deacetylase family metallohydrolase [Psychromarinibacter sediminicola]MDF0603556.1 amidohydrolase/deacetylase family metallohydrolase [Psychromarinibacter sediminicola]
MTHDLVLTGGRVIDPDSGLDRVTDLAFADGCVAAIGDGLDGADMRDVSGALVVPGLIDLHTHVYWGGTSLSVEADDYARRCAATTLVDTGSAGPGNFPGFRAHVMAPAEVRILSFLHISFAGIYAFSPTVMVGESLDMRLMASKDVVAVARDNPDTVVGIKVRVGRNTSGPNGIAPLDLALEAADRCGLPVMAHIDLAPPTYAEVCEKLRPGDVLTHCFRPFPNGPVDAAGAVHDAALRARDRGVLFDIGHGMGAFSWESARAAMAAGFMPDTISSDVHVLCIDGPAWDLLRTMTKLMALGMSLEQVIAAATLTPARAMRRDDLGRLAVGGVGEASVIAVEDGPVELEDVLGETVAYDRSLRARGMVIGGRFVEAAGQRP